MSVSNSPFARIKKPLNATMNVVPYIDVMLVLLVIFMVTAPLLTTGVEVDLPKAKADAIASTTQLPIIISLQADGALFISYDDKTDQPISQTELVSLLQSRQQNLTDTMPSILINADQHNQYGQVMQLMANLQQAGIEKVGLITRSPNKP